VTSIDEVKATIRQGNQAASQARQTIESAAARAEAAGSLAGQAVHDSRHAEVQKALTALREAIREAELVSRRLDDAAGHADRYLGMLG
jgi:hypothetical protein